MVRQQTLLLIGITFAHSLSHAYILAFPILLPFIRSDLLLTYQELGLLSGVLLVTYGLTTFPSGWLSDIIGTRNVMIIYLALLTCTSFLLISITSFPALLVYLCILGLIAGLYHPPGLSLISQSFDSEDLGKMFGVHGISGNIGSATAPGITVLIASTQYGWQYALIPFGLISVIAIPFFLVLSTKRIEKPNKKPESTQVFESQITSKNRPKILVRPLIVILLISALVGLIDRGLISFLTIYLVDARQYSPTTAGFIVTISFAIAILGQITFGYLADYKGAILTFQMAIIALIILLVLIPYSPGIILLIILIFTTFVVTGIQPPLSILTTSVGTSEKRGTVFGLQFIAVFGIGGTAGFLVGEIASRFSLDAIYPILSGLGVLSLILLLIYPILAAKYSLI